MAESLNLRVTAELTFVADDSIEYGSHINTLLHKIEKTMPETGAAPEETENE